MHRTNRFAMLLKFTLLLTLGGRDLLAQAPDAPSDTLIRLGRVTFDPRVGEPALAQALRAAPKSGPNTYLLQFNGPVEEAWKAAAAQAGAHLYGYIPEHAFIARIDSVALATVRALPFVRWVGLYHPAYRLDAALDASRASGSVTIEAQTLPDADLDALSQMITRWGGTVAGRATNEIAGYLRATLPAARLGDLAGQGAVLWVAPYIAPQLHNNIAGGQIMRANEVRQSLGLFGAGQTVAVADTGLDVGNAATIHPDFQGRIVKAYCLGRTSPCDWSDADGHGTHVAGSVLGSGNASGSDPANHQYPSTSFAGVAPEAKLVMQSIGDADNPPGLGGIPNDVGDLMRQAYGDGARIHTNSWGGATGGSINFPQYGGYVENSQQVDLAAWQQKDMLILFSAGNSGTDANRNGVIDPDSISQPGTAKNVVTVGASENLRATGGYNPGSPACGTWGECFPNSFGVAPLAGDTPSDDANGMAAFSSRGPTDDGRIKPDIVAPGTNILSTRSHHPQAGIGWGAYNADYIFEGGTSMSTPLTAGAAALAREWLGRSKGITNPSSALMKSVLINGAADMSPGQYGSDASREIPSRRPNNVTGWGRVDLAEALSPAAPRKIWLTDNIAGLTTGGSATYQLNVSAAQAAAAHKPSELASSAGQSVGFTFSVLTNSGFPSEAWVDDAALNVTTSGGTNPTPTATTPPTPAGGPLRVTLAWTDYPGEPSAAKALVNDLDLEVIAPDGTHYSGNQGLYTTGQCLRAGTWDACNNIEGIIIPMAGPGTYTIIVHGAQVPQGGAQPFALVASGNGLQPPQRLVYVSLILQRSAALAQSHDSAPNPTPLPTPVAVNRKEER